MILGEEPASVIDDIREVRFDYVGVWRVVNGCCSHICDVATKIIIYGGMIWRGYCSLTASC